jgi:2-oxoglutarate dehydrogenase E1 component
MRINSTGPSVRLLAYGSLLVEGNNVRFSGQDVVRGTFSHRHAKVFDEKTSEAYCPLDNIQDNKER